MIKINLVAVGKVKEKYFQEGIAEYAKRIKRFADFSITEISEENYKETTEGIIETIKEKEGEKILPYLKGYVIAMAIEGEKTDSGKFAKKIRDLENTGVSKITFIIGGSYGLSDTVKKSADMLMSFSDMTFPHTLFRLMATEQIYRAFTILNGTKYHK